MDIVSLLFHKLISMITNFWEAMAAFSVIIILLTLAIVVIWKFVISKIRVDKIKLGDKIEVDFETDSEVKNVENEVKNAESKPTVTNTEPTTSKEPSKSETPQ